jgi:ribosome-binding factor A
MTDKARARKLADRIRVITAEMIERGIKDPRLGFVTITDAKVTGDLREATVYYTVYGGPEDIAGSAAALESARGLIRSAVGKATGVKHTPSIAFVADIIPENAHRIDELLSKAREADQAVQAVAEGAVPAGDPDPYRQPREVEVDEEEDADEETA